MNYISEIRVFQGLKWYIDCLSYVNFNLFVLIIWGADATETEISRKRCYEKCSSLQTLCLCVFTIYTKAASVWQPHSSLVLGEHFEA